MNKVNHKFTVYYLNYLFNNIKDSKLIFNTTKEMNEAFEHLSDLLNLTNTQSALLSIIFTFTVDEDLERVKTNRILSCLGLGINDYFTILNDLELLYKRGYIHRRNEDRSDNFYNSSFVINQMLLDKIFRNEAIEFDKLPGNGYSFKQFSRQMFRVCRFSLIDQHKHEEIYNSIIEHEEKTEHLTQIQNMMSQGLAVQDRLVLYYLTYNYCYIESEISTFNIGVDVYGKDNVSEFLVKLNNNETLLQQKELIKLDRLNEIQFTDRGKELLELDNFYIPNNEEVKTSHYLIKHDTIAERNLYFDKPIQRDLNILETLLIRENFDEYQKVMKQKKNKSEGIAVLLYGPSGTGKSSIVEQLARKTNRNILHVDLSVLRDKYWGESEKKIKALFEEYQTMIEKSENVPILLINECDAILGKRITSLEAIHDYTESTMTNLMLEFFEKNKGIIIATTNLEQNIDTAFLRRFTLKYYIGKPDKRAVEMILKSKLEFLDDREISRIAEYQDLTGGQIENISMKCDLNKIITKSFPTVAEIIEYCEDEKIRSNKWSDESQYNFG